MEIFDALLVLCSFIPLCGFVSLFCSVGGEAFCLFCVEESTQLSTFLEDSKICLCIFPCRNRVQWQQPGSSV